MIEIKRAEACCGCSACEERCLRQCITMQEDREGFRYPLVDREACIECGLCEKVCPVLHPFMRAGYDTVQVYACKSRDEDTRRKSSSGGLFSVLAEAVLAEGGVVFGARFDEMFGVCHDSVSRLEELPLLRGSKYVQSRMNGSFRQAEKILKIGIPVLFTGTSCQIAGLRRFLRRPYENLLAVDVLCHGVPSAKVYARYLEEQRQAASIRYGAPLRLEQLSFRDKSEWGWGRYAVVRSYGVQGEDTAAAAADRLLYREALPFTQDLFMRGFLHDLYLRPSCYECPARNLEAGSDLTLADYWGIGKVHPEMDDNGGTSLVVVQTEHGRQFFQRIADKLVFCETPFEEALPGNPCLIRSVARPRRRRLFFERFERGEDLMGLIARMTRRSLLVRLRRKVRGTLRRIRASRCPETRKEAGIN